MRVQQCVRYARSLSIRACVFKRDHCGYTVGINKNVGATCQQFLLSTINTTNDNQEYTLTTRQPQCCMITHHQFALGLMGSLIEQFHGVLRLPHFNKEKNIPGRERMVTDTTEIYLFMEGCI